MYLKWENKKRLQTNLSLVCCVSSSWFISDQLSYNSLLIANNIIEVTVPLGRKITGKKQSNLSPSFLQLVAPLFPALPSKFQVSVMQQVPSFVVNFFPLSSYLMCSCSQQRGKYSLCRHTPEKKCRGQINQSKSLFPNCSAAIFFKETISILFFELQQRIK